ncbi:MAG: hypothetical protein GXP29_09495 [Planctomycetes bacterium]|nr:hypothetical protein [Planctomycetota bacterium]
MEKDTFLLHQFDTIREEIKAVKARSFWIVALGLFGVPALTFLAEFSEKFVSLLVPYVVLVTIILFVAEQSALMRCGRYIRQVIEPNIKSIVGWEEWLESRNELRLMDRHFFACFVIVFFVYYFMTIGVAMQTLWGKMAQSASDQYWVYGAMATYAIGAVWAVMTLLHHWRSATGTSDED